MCIGAATWCSIKQSVDEATLRLVAAAAAAAIALQ